MEHNKKSNDKSFESNEKKNFRNINKYNTPGSFFFFVI